MRTPVAVVVSADPRIAGRARQVLEGQLDVVVCRSVREAADTIRDLRPELVVAHCHSDRIDGLETQFLNWLQVEFTETHLIVGSDSQQGSAAARRLLPDRVATVSAGSRTDLVTAVRRFFPSFASRRSRPVTSRSDTAADYMRQRFRTSSPQLQEMLQRLAIAATHDVTILLVGETGCGKTFLSHLIHETSRRAGAPFLHVACGALPADLIESELFGHVRGAFTGAHANKDGKFLAAGRGTVLLDEVDVLRPEQQVKLLRVIETGEFEPVGSNQTLHSQARLIAASNRELPPLVESGCFRPDLYYRLNMLEFDIPPLRDRPADIAPLASHFVEAHARTHGVDAEVIEPGFLDVLHAYPWPGNVRELENAVHSAVIYSQAGRVRAADLPGHIIAAERRSDQESGPEESGVSPGSGALDRRLRVKEREIIEEALARHNQSRTQTAAHLGISRVTLYNKMKRHGILD